MSSIQNKGLDLHLYKERLDRHAERAASDLADARLAAAWCDIDDKLRMGLSDADQRVLDVIGVLSNDDRRATCEATAAHCVVVLKALHGAQRIVAELIAARKRDGYVPFDADKRETATEANARQERPEPHCPACMGKGFGDPKARHLTRCKVCAGTGLYTEVVAPQYESVVMIVDTSTDEGAEFLECTAESMDAVVHLSAFSGTDDALRWLDDMAPVHREQAAADLADYEQEG